MFEHVTVSPAFIAVLCIASALIGAVFDYLFRDRQFP
jgi:hypothetical protein